jgi:hypothetical protein
MTPTYLPALYGKPEIPKALTESKEQRHRDQMADLWDWVTRHDIILTFTYFHPKNSALALSAWFDRQMEGGWEPQPEDFEVYATC